MKIRNPERIKIILTKLEEYWSKNPNLRLGQIIANFNDEPSRDIFYLEDEDLEKTLDYFLK